MSAWMSLAICLLCTPVNLYCATVAKGDAHRAFQRAILVFNATMTASVIARNFL